ncbi:uncharacterized protein [Palaemon carinicauda]|uniref:uncharacterized protein n=1 Tax=Palaemon carinicauda TaxID=392227 RepID=UPI0035B67466
MSNQQGRLSHRSGVGSFPQPKRRFGHIHVDIVGPLPPLEDARYLLAIIDCLTRWLETTPMTEASPDAFAQALLSSWVNRFAILDDMTTDRGPAFISDLWAFLTRLMGTNMHSTTAYNPAANGMVERSHRSLKTALMARCTDEHWVKQLPWVLLGLQMALKANGDASLTETVCGEMLVVPREFFPSNPDTEDISLAQLRERAGKFMPHHKMYADRTKHIRPASPNTCPYVFVRQDGHRPPLSRPYKGPYCVLERTKKAFKVMIHGAEVWLTMDRFKPAYTESDVDVHKQHGRRPRVPPQNKQIENV